MEVTPSAQIAVRGGIALIDTETSGRTTAPLLYGDSLQVSSAQGSQQITRPGFAVTVDTPLPAGVSEVKAGCLMPGPFSLVVISVGLGGGKRWGYEITAERGVTVIGRDQGHGRETVVAIVQDQDWQIAWSVFKDGALTSQRRAQIDGVWTQAADGSDPELLPWA